MLSLKKKKQQNQISWLVINKQSDFNGKKKKNAALAL
jgi:hypothetical protein